MNRNKILKLRYKLTWSMCKNEYRWFSKELYKYVVSNYEIEDNICNDLQDIWDMLINYSSQNIDFNEVIPNKDQFINDLFINYTKVKKPKILLYIIFLCVIPAIIGILTYIQLTYY